MAATVFTETNQLWLKEAATKNSQAQSEYSQNHKSDQNFREMVKCIPSISVPLAPITIVSKSCGCNDGHCDHDQPAAAPHVLHEELLNHDVPEAL